LQCYAWVNAHAQEQESHEKESPGNSSFFSVDGLLRQEFS